ncbi:MAG: T9SS type A sorting domain-containing protein [Bacteroidia bacterium]|nr:T9SS type A sorting domain-containing protein [Bacteroidia bacterium]
MRKIYALGLFMLIMASGAFAQRAIDWSVDEIVTPTELQSDTNVGTVFDIEIVLKNNGTETVKTTDTGAYQFVFQLATGQLLFAYPIVNGAAGFTLRPIKREVPSGDTIHEHWTLTFPRYTFVSTNTMFTAASILINRGADSITDGTTANNVNTKNLVWWNRQGWGVGVNDVVTNDVLNVYPNPASTEVKVSWNIGSVDEKAVVRIFDLNGRMVAEKTASSSAFEQSLDISELDAGMYMVEVHNGDFKTTKKLQVLR